MDIYIYFGLYDGGNGMSLTKYSIGFVLSLALTLLAYFLTTERVSFGLTLVITLLVLAFTQALVQLIFFLHLGEVSHKSHLNWALLMMATLFIVVGGSIWAMYNMNTNMNYLTPTQKESIMLYQYDKGGF